MTKVDRTLQALHEIRDEVRANREEVRTELRELRGEMHELRGDVHELRERHVQTEIRLATELVAVVGAVREVRDAIVGQGALIKSVADHEQRITALERRTG